MQALGRRRMFFAVIAAMVLVSSGWMIYQYLFGLPFGLNIVRSTGQQGFIVRTVQPDSPADRAGLQSDDIIVGVNGIDISRAGSKAWSILNAGLQDPDADVSIIRGDTLRHVQIQGSRIHISSRFIAFTLVGLLYLVMGSWVFLARPRYEAAAAWSFFALLMAGFIFSLGTGPMDSTELISRLVGVLVAAMFFFSAAAGLHFALVFPTRTQLTRKSWVLPTIYIIPAILFFLVALTIFLNTLLSPWVDQLQEVRSILSVLAVAFWIIYQALIIMTLVRTYLETRDIEGKRRMRAIIFGTTATLGGLLALSLLETLGIELLPSAPLNALIFAIIPVTYFYAIVRYRAMQVRFILRRGLVYSIVTGTVLLATALAFVAGFGVILLLQDLLPSLGREGGAFHSLVTDDSMQKFTIAVWSVLIGATFGRIKRKVQSFVDKQFYRERYSYRQSLRALNRVLEQTSDRRSMFEIVIENAQQMVHPRSVAILIRQQDDSGLVEQAQPEALSQLRLKTDSLLAFVKAFENKRVYLGLQELNEEGLADAELLHASMVRLSADICLPLQVDGRCLGFLFLGSKRSESSYNLEEIELLKSLADQAAIGVEHFNLAREAAEKETYRRELEIGRTMQQSLLPSRVPAISGLELAALNRPALEVGGDFYSFVTYSPKKLGCFVGDIVGKGVAGALNMAATISSLKLIAEESASVNEALQRLNRYLVKNTERRSFAAVVFCVIDLESMQFIWSNAGLPDPIIISGDEFPRYLESEIYPLPPGASPNSAYIEQKHPLKRGDVILLTSDGVVEAQSEKSGEQFGYDRLLTFLNKNRDRAPEILVEMLRNEVEHWCGESHHEDDDLTIVALRLHRSSRKE